MTAAAKDAAALRAIADDLDRGPGLEVDALMRLNGIEGVTNVDQYRAWVTCADSGRAAAARLLRGVAARIEGEGDDGP